MVKAFIKKIFSETVRDITAFGNPFVLSIILALIIGINLIFFKIILGLISVEVFCTIIKFFYHKERPNKETYNNLLERINAESFPSLHTARSTFVFLMLFFLTSIYSIKILLIIMIFLVGISRIIMKKHYLFDVIVGAIIGIIFSVLWGLFII
jgi:membrane-associated phospholipid phosphatase